MPASTPKQQRLFGMALAMKRGKRLKNKGPALKIAKELSETKIKDFALTRMPNA